MSKYKNWEGSTPVNGDVTPITKQKIEQLDSSQWESMSNSQLYDQRIILTTRIAQASAVGQISIVHQLERGLQYLDGLLASRGNSDEIHLL